MTLLRRALLASVLVLALVGTTAARPYAWLGVRIRDLSEQEMEELATRHGVREGFGVYIVDVVEGAPAEKSGLRKGDVVVAVNGRPIVETRLLQRLVGSESLEQDVRLTVLRSHGRSEVVVRLAAMPPTVAGERTAAEFGFVLREAEGAGSAAAVGFDGTPAIVAVLRGSPAERAGLIVGDVILEVNGRPVLSGVAAREALADVESGSPLRLTFRRGADQHSLTLRP